MFHKAVELVFKEGTVLEVTFQDGNVKQYDMAVLYGKYPQLRALEDRTLFCSGRLLGGYIIVWNDELDIETATIYEEGKTVRNVPPAPNVQLGEALLAARAGKKVTQKELAALSGIDQSDISKIERGGANPSVNTLMRLAKALGRELTIRFE